MFENLYSKLLKGSKGTEMHNPAELVAKGGLPGKQLDGSSKS